MVRNPHHLPAGSARRRGGRSDHRRQGQVQHPGGHPAVNRLPSAQQGHPVCQRQRSRRPVCPGQPRGTDQPFLQAEGGAQGLRFADRR